MSYVLISLLLSLIMGGGGMILLVLINAPAENAFRVVWGSLAFAVMALLLALGTVGWLSAAVTTGSGIAVAFLLGKAGDVAFTWGRALIEVANRYAHLLGPVSRLLRFVGCKLKDSQVPLNRMFSCI